MLALIDKDTATTKALNDCGASHSPQCLVVRADFEAAKGSYLPSAAEVDAWAQAKAQQSGGRFAAAQIADAYKASMFGVAPSRTTSGDLSDAADWVRGQMQDEPSLSKIAMGAAMYGNASLSAVLGSGVMSNQIAAGRTKPAAGLAEETLAPAQANPRAIPASEGSVVGESPVKSGGTANSATGARLNEDLARISKPEPKVVVADDGSVRYTYGSIKQAQGLEASVDAQGVLRIEIKSGSRREQYGSGADMFDDMMSNVSGKVPVKEIQGQWSNMPGLSDNYDAFLKNLAANGGNAKAAAADTWTGRQAARYAYYFETVSGDANTGFVVRFVKKEKP